MLSNLNPYPVHVLTVIRSLQTTSKVAETFFVQVQLYMLDEHERASKEAAAHLSQQGEQRQQLRQKLAHQFQLMLLRGDSDLELALIRRELANLYDSDDE